jgi:CRISPR system Cascade subunit CasD
MEARKVTGRANPNPVVSRREYLCDTCFTVALGCQPESTWDIDQIKAGLLRPAYTPFLGRRSCPLARPLYECELEAESLIDVLIKIYPHKGLIYSEEAEQAHSRLLVRDVPTGGVYRQFSTRYVYIHPDKGGKGNVSQ